MTRRNAGSRKKAIDAFCKDCIYDSDTNGLGTWRKQVQDCPSVKCALYAFRPTPENEAEIEPNAEQEAREGMDEGKGTDQGNNGAENGHSDAQ